jgi:hypothetical protein
MVIRMCHMAVVCMFHTTYYRQRQEMSAGKAHGWCNCRVCQREEEVLSTINTHKRTALRETPRAFGNPREIRFLLLAWLNGKQEDFFSPLRIPQSSTRLPTTSSLTFLSLFLRPTSIVFALSFALP